MSDPEDEMPAGPEMDALIVKAIFDGPLHHQPSDPEFGYGVECRRCHVDLYYPEFRGQQCLPPFSTDDVAALEVFKKAAMSGDMDTIFWFPRIWDNERLEWKPGLPGKWTVGTLGWDGFKHDRRSEAPTLALAICREMLKAHRRRSQ